MTAELDLRGPIPRGRIVIEASAGTGKTYSLSALIVRHVAELERPASSLLVVTFTKAAAAELRDRSRRALVDALAVFDGSADPTDSWMEVLVQCDTAERQRRRQRIAYAIASFDDATITTIHGFCQQALRQLGVRSAAALTTSLGRDDAMVIDEVCRDLVIGYLLDDASLLSWDSRTVPADVVSALKKSVTAVLGNPGARTVPVTGPPETLTRWIDLVDRAVREVGRRCRLRNEQGFDDLITGLRDAIEHPVDGKAVVAALNERYQVVMVDEFQDTDAVQWQIFDRGFHGDMVLVGDPKQAIYRFRGADVHAYLAATEAQPTVRLATNHRSDADAVAAVNSLLDGVELGDERIVAVPVAAAPTAPTRALQPGAPLVIRRVPAAAAGSSTDDARRVIVDDLVGVVVDLLEHHHLDRANLEPGRPEPGGSIERVTPGHIAVLVPSHSTAELVVDALAAAGVPAVRTRTGSVLTSPASDEWVRLLAAVERPSSSAAVRAAGLGVFFACAPGELDPLSAGSDERVAELQQRCAQWAADLSRMPFLAWYDRVRAESGVVATLLGRRGGERHLTDLDHIAELVAVDLRSVGTSAAAARRSLDELRSTSGDADERDAQMRRIDSDADAVQITTLHSSKGLEYPIVLMPFSWQQVPADGLSVYHDLDRGCRVIDIAGRWKWKHGLDTDDVRSHRTYIERFGDQLRLLYVGLTRGRHRTVLWWAPVNGVEKWALSTLLFDRDHEGAPLNTRPGFTDRVNSKGVASLDPVKVSPPVDDDRVDAALQTLVKRSNGLIDTALCRDLSAPTWWPGATREVSAREVSATELSIADHGGREVIDPTWRRWSFSSVTRTRQHLGHGGSLDELAPVVGGADEPGDDPPIAGGPASPGMPLADVMGGRAFGTLIHSVLEGFDPTVEPLEAELRAGIETQLEIDRLALDPEVLVDGLAAAVRTPLGPVVGELRLADIAVTDRLVELAFDLPLAATTGRVAASRIGQVLLDTLSADDPQRAYAASLADGRFAVEMAGYLQGSIDAVLRVRGADGTPRFVVVDYKTNRLHERGAPDPMAAYHPDRLPEAMAQHDYPLQALLYSVAVHRYLRWRMPHYDPALHLGGIAYLFVRGMIGPATPLDAGRPFGVFTWTPPTSTIEALDRLLATGGVR